MPKKDGTGPVAGKTGRRQREETGAGPSGYCICQNAAKKQAIRQEYPVLPKNAPNSVHLLQEVLRYYKSFSIKEAPGKNTEGIGT